MKNPPNRKTSTPHPDHTLENACREAGHRVVVLWEMKGLPQTAVFWMVGYQIGRAIVIVQTYSDNNGWQAFTSSPTNDVDMTIKDILARAG